MHLARTLLLCLLLAPLAWTARAAGPPSGVPLLRHYTAEQTKAAPNHLALATGATGELFVGNLEGVLRYDGVAWQLIPLSGGSPARSLATGADGLVYVGGYDTFGRLARNRDGNHAYEDLLDRAGLRKGQRHLGVVWEVLPVEEGVYFHAEESLHYLPYGDGPARRWALGPDIRGFHLVGGELHARVDGKGLCRVDDGRFELVPGGEIFAGRVLAGIVTRDGWQLLVSRDGLFRWDASGIKRLPGPAGQLLAGRRSYVVQGLDDGSFVVGTHDGELFRIGPDFALRETVDLGNFGINDLGLDREGGLWAATESDLVRLSMPSPWSFLGSEQGLVGTPTDFAWHDGNLWITSTRGVARWTPDGQGRFEVEMKDWTEFEGDALHAGEAGLLVGLREGLVALDAGSSEPRELFRHPYHGVFALQPSRHPGGRVFGLTATQLLVLGSESGRWRLQHKLDLAGVSVSGFEEGAPGELWIGDSRGAVQRWRIDLDTGEVLQRDVFDDTSGLAVDADTGTSIFQLDGAMHAVSGNRGFRFDGERFVADRSPPFTLVERPMELAVETTPLGVYAYTSRQLWRRDVDGGEWVKQYPGAQASAGYAHLRFNADGVLRIATWNGLLQFDPREKAPTPQPLRLAMASVQARAPGGEMVPLPSESGSTPVSVPAGHGINLRFEMVSMESGAEFRYLLHGVTPEWSDWTDRDLFIRALPAGDYVLEVEARTRNGRQGPTMHYTFRVDRRWFEQWWVLALGLAALAGLAIGITLWAVRRRTERYLAANRRLEARIAERTRELEDVNRQLADLVTEDALTGVANRRALETGLRREWLRCLDQRRPLSVLMIDVDNFKSYNDEHGHLEGDIQLRGLAQSLHQQHDPRRELLARYGGEEFVLLLPGEHLAEALRRAELLRSAIAASDAGMTVSIGVAGFVPDVQSEPETLLRRADAALYAAKRAGRNRVEADPTP